MLASIVGGTITGAIISTVGLLPRLVLSHDLRIILFVAVLIVAILLELLGKAHLWTVGNFVVPASWVAKGDQRAATLWGLILGLGFLTWTGTLLNMYFVGILLADRWWHGMLAGAIFGLSRSIVATIPQFRVCVLNAVEGRRGRYSTLSFWMRIFSFSVLIVALTVAAVELMTDRGSVLSMLTQAIA